MRILLLTLYYAPDFASANAIIMTTLAEQLVQLGHEVRVISSFPHYANNVLEGPYRRQLFQKEVRDGVHVTHTYLYTSPKKKSVWRRLLNYASFNVLSTAAALFAGKYDVILAPSPPLTMGLTAWLVSRLKGIPFVYNVQDVYPDIAVSLGVLKNPRMIELFRHMEAFIYRNAAAVTVLSEGFRCNLLQKGVPEEKIQVIPNFVDTSFVQPLPRKNAFSQQHGLDDKFVLLYAGNLGLSQRFDEMLDVARRLQALPDFRLLIVGNGIRRAALEQQVQAFGLSNVRFLPFQERETLPELYASADAALVTLHKNVDHESVPSKIYTIMASGRPVLAVAGNGTETRRLITVAECGLHVEPDDVEGCVAAVRALYEDPALRQTLGHNGRQYVTAHYRHDLIAQQYAKLLHAVALGIVRAPLERRTPLT